MVKKVLFSLFVALFPVLSLSAQTEVSLTPRHTITATMVGSLWEEV